MKIAVFGTMWNEESFRYYYDGLNMWAEQTGNIVDIFTCYGRTDIEDKFDWGEYMIYDLADFSQYDGAIVVSSIINQDQVRKRLDEKIKAAGIPCVVIENVVKGFSSITLDQELYVKELVDHLIDDHGCATFAYIGGPDANVEANKRQKGFEKSLFEHGIRVDTRLVLKKSFAYNDGVDAVNSIFASGADIPDAVVCANDDMATGVCDALLERGYQLGRDIIVTGFDNYYVGENYSPKLTTIKRPRKQLTYRACEVLSEQILNGGSEQHIIEKAEIVFGETCGCGKVKCQNNNTFRRNVFRRDNNREMIHNLMNRMEERILSGEGLINMIGNVQQMLDKFSDGKCRINLAPDIENNISQPFDSYLKCTQEYVYWQKGEVTASEGHAFIYAPIHFLDHLYGYTCFRDIDPFMHDQQLYQFTKSIGFSIENVVQKKKYEVLNTKLDTLYETDNLTGAYNRHGLARYAESFYRRHMNDCEPIDVIFVDVDFLKVINDKLGHEAGDQAISIVGKALMSTKTRECLVFRYGGDEFLILRDHTLDFEHFEDMIKKNVAERAKSEKIAFDLSVSMGCVTVETDDDTPLDVWISEADKRMYEEKKHHHKKSDN